MPHPTLFIHNISSLYTLNPKYITGTNPLGLLKNTSIGFVNDKISFIGDATSSEAIEGKNVAAIVIDGTGFIGLPGLVDCHTHTVWAGSRADEFARRLAGEKYADIAKAGGGILSTVEHTRNATLNELVTNAKSRIQNMVRKGVTTVEIKSGYGLSPDAEAKMLRAAKECNDTARIVTTFLGAHALPKEFRDNRKGYVQQVINDQLPIIQKYELADNIDVFCDSIGFTLEEAKDILTAGQRAGMKVKAHAEQIQHTGCTSLVSELNGISADHLERVKLEDVKNMAAKNVVAVCLPGAQMYLHDTSPPVQLFRENNVKMAVATDLNPGSSPVHDLFTSATLACVLQSMTIVEAVEGITKNAGLALGRNDLGWLGIDGASVGDMILCKAMEGDPPTVESLIQNIGGHDLVTTIRDGEVIYNNMRYGKTS